MTTLSRRDFLKYVGLGSVGAAAMFATACSTKGDTGSSASGTGAASSGAASSGASTTAPVAVTETATPDQVATATDLVSSGYDILSFKAPEGTVSKKDTLNIRLDEDNGHLDTLTGSTYIQAVIVKNLCSHSLLTEGFDQNGNQCFTVTDYSIADEVEEKQDGITFHIREGLKFHNGNPLTTEDVVYSIKRWSIKPQYNYIDFENVKAMDGNKVYMPFIKYNSGWNGMMRSMAVMDRNAAAEAEQNGTWEDFVYTSDAHCGAYNITEWQSGDHVYMVADPNWYMGEPLIKNINIRFISDDTVAMMEMESGGVDICYDPAQIDVQGIIDGTYGDAVRCYANSSDMLVQMGFNVAGVLADQNLREAVCRAIDWKTAVVKAYGLAANPPTTLLTNSFAYLRDVSEWWNNYYDLEKAKELMKQSAHPDGGFELIILVNGQAEKTALCEIMAKMLLELNITLKIESYDTATYDAKMRTTEGWDLWLREWGGLGNFGGSIDSDASLGACTSAIAVENDKYQLMGRIGDELQETADPVKAQELADEWQDGYLEGSWMYYFPVAQNNRYVVFNADLVGFSSINNDWHLAQAYFK